MHLAVLYQCATCNSAMKNTDVSLHSGHARVVITSALVAIIRSLLEPESLSHRFLLFSDDTLAARASLFSRIVDSHSRETPVSGLLYRRTINYVPPVSCTATQRSRARTPQFTFTTGAKGIGAIGASSADGRRARLAEKIDSPLIFRPNVSLKWLSQSSLR